MVAICGRQAGRGDPRSCVRIAGHSHRAARRPIDHIEIRATLPVTETGKLFRRALKAESLMR
jgi:acyl-coenzyme A synthetase/AMP-(fatty) acid ligase